MMKDENIPLAEIVEELENGSRPEGGVDNSGDIFSVGGEHLNDFGGFDFSSVKMISHDFYNKMNRGKIKPDDIVIVKDGATTGKTSFVNEQFPHFPCAINEHVFRLAVNQKVADPKYVFYYLYSSKGNKEILDDFRGATVGGISQDFVNKVFIPLPPLTEQKRIASLLARADRLRQLRRTAHDLSASVLQSVFLEMFGDIAKNEKGWNAEKLEDLCDEITVGYVGPMQSEYNQGGVVFLRSQNIKPFRIDLNDVKYVSPEFHKKLKKSAIYPGNVVVVRTGLAGTAAVVPDNFPTANCSDLVIIRPSSKINNQYLAMLFNSTWGKGHVSGNAVGQIQQHFNIGSANEMKVPLPPLALQEEFARVVARVESLRGRMSEAERLVEGLFESLLAQSFETE